MVVKFPPATGPELKTLDMMRYEMELFDRLPPRVREALATSAGCLCIADLEMLASGFEAGFGNEESVIRWLTSLSRQLYPTIQLGYTPSVKSVSRKR